MSRKETFLHRFALLNKYNRMPSDLNTSLAALLTHRKTHFKPKNSWFVTITSGFGPDTSYSVLSAVQQTDWLFRNKHCRATSSTANGAN